MRTILCIATICVVSACASAPVNLDTPLIGTWSGKDNKNVVFGFVFERNGNIDLLKSGRSMSAEIRDSGARLVYEIDSSTKPERFDVFGEVQGQRRSLTSCIYQFLSADEIQIRCNMPGGPIPKEFASSAANEILKLVRVMPAR